MISREPQIMVQDRDLWHPNFPESIITEVYRAVGVSGSLAMAKAESEEK